MFYPCMDFSFINEPHGFLNMFAHLNIFWQSVSQFNNESCGKRNSQFSAVWWFGFPTACIRNVRLQLSFAFPFSLLFFSQLYFIIFCLLDQKIIFWYLFYSLYPLMILPYSCLKYVEKNHTLLKVMLHFGIYIGTIMFSVTPFIFSVMPNSSFFPCHWSDVLKECFSNTTWRGCYSLWKFLGICFCIVFAAVTGICLKEQHGIYTIDLATSPTLSTLQIFCSLPSVKNRIMKEKYSTPELLNFSDTLQ